MAYFQKWSRSKRKYPILYLHISHLQKLVHASHKTNQKYKSHITFTQIHISLSCLGADFSIFLSPPPCTYLGIHHEYNSITLLLQDATAPETMLLAVAIHVDEISKKKILFLTSQ
jgi:hypothetical protein